MQTKGILTIAALMAATAIPTIASAATLASATVDLHIRSGPGPQYAVVGVIPDNAQATILGCIQGSAWCQVSYNGQQGWAYSRYLTAEVGGQPVVIAQNRAAVGVPVVTYESPATGAAVGAATGARTGALVAGPVGAAVGGTVGAITGTVGAVASDILTPPEQVVTYVTSHPVQPVFLNGEVVVGAGIPPNVELYPVPNSSYEYAYINSVPVLVSPASRRIVYVY